MPRSIVQDISISLGWEQISVAGVHYGELEQYLKTEVSKNFRNFNLTATSDIFAPFKCCGRQCTLPGNLHH